MPVVASANLNYSIRLAIVVLLCIGAALWFSYDGWKNWPAQNDKLIKYVIDNPRGTQGDQVNMDKFKAWPGYAIATPEQIAAMDITTKQTDISDWKTSHDIWLQRILGVGVGVVAIFFIWKFISYRTRHRAVADDTSLSPGPGVVIPWDNITKVDNTLWKKKGIVTLTYTDAGGQEKTAVLDEFDLDHLVPVLMELEKHAKKAEFISPPEDSAEPQKS